MDPKIEAGFKENFKKKSKSTKRKQTSVQSHPVAKGDPSESKNPFFSTSPPRFEKEKNIRTNRNPNRNITKLGK